MFSKSQVRITAIVLSAGMLGLPVAQASTAETRTTNSSYYSAAERAAGVPGRTSQDEHGALQTTGSRDDDRQANPTGKTAERRSSAPASDNFWFYDVDVLLFNDHDVDGHYHGIDLLFDADTYYSSAEVYAVVYLSLEGGPWNEYSATENFLLFGASADDEYNIVTELVAGYPTGSYDLLIELFDGYNDRFLTSIGPVDTSELAFLPLEDANRDTPYVPPPPPPSTTVIVEDGGGALGWLSILVLLAGRRWSLRKLRHEGTQ